MKLDKFYQDTIILTISNLTTGILRFVFSIILSNKLGAEGLGLYSLIMPVYDLFSCIVCAGIIVSISRKCAILNERNDHFNICKLIHTTLIFELVWSSLVALLLFINSNFVGNALIRDVRTIYSIEIICPALVFIALSSVFKGYFYGISNAKIPAFIDIFEKAIRIAVVICIVNLFLLKNLIKIITAVYAALTFGEIISFIMLYITYYIYRKKHSEIYTNSYNNGQILFDILAVSIPLCINGFLTSLLNAASTLIVPRRLVFAGFSYSSALSLIGKFTGMALNITFFPMVVIMSMSTLIVPDISKNLASKNFYCMEKRIKEVISLSFYIGISAMIISLCIPNNLGLLFYGRNDIASFVMAASVSAPITFAAASTYSILSGLELQTKILINSLIVSIEEVVLLFILTGIYFFNIYGFAITLFITSMTSYFLNMHEIKKICTIHFSLTPIFLDILFAILLFLILGIMNNIIPNSIFLLKNILIMCTGFVLYLFLAVEVKKGILSSR